MPSYLLTALLLAAHPAAPAPAACPWAATWGSSQMEPGTDNALAAGRLAGATLRQVARVSIGGDAVRVRLSNAFGHQPLRIAAAAIGRTVTGGRTPPVAADARALTFAGRPDVLIPAGADWWSDPVAMPVAAFADLAVSLDLPDDPQGQTGHPGSRATSWLARGARAGDAALSAAEPTAHWFFLAGIEVRHCGAARGVVAFGDSITDGYGVRPDTNARWTDALARRLGGRVAVVNQGIGGNRILRDGLGPNALARFDRDVLSQPGIGHVIVLEGINDIGVLQRDAPASVAEQDALVAQVTGAYAQMIARAHERGIRIYGGTVMPFMANGYYHPDAGSERMRGAINAWIRTPGRFDAVVDFDRAMRDPARPAYLAPAYDSGDGLHPSEAGYRAMAAAVPLALLR
ncbi:SGNH/GDSL hydrolase family protein [Sphingomonas sp. A2-49]|uniref:SGNH/GDSL hydrolase family protein n=1 Tax=Sphingomonas sp. A2-49 TaxID=1391375 RepID=UPI0021CF49A5|nr:SGNH/GDSL hydrolase family protein [Sphingomonas sp. A2-49]MCU6453740.1 SGNH/GDSL hydrolase family protein [Sphingomonas sp. A2-49]